MPTIIALDVSMSMCRPALLDLSSDCKEEYSLQQLAINGINKLLDYMAINCKLEFTALVIYSYLWEQLVAFTRDFEQIKSALSNCTVYNKTVFATALNGIESIITTEWGHNTPSQAILVTDGQVGQDSLLSSLTTLPFGFPCKIHVVCVCNPNDVAVKKSVEFYQKIIDTNGQGGEVFLPEGGFTLQSVEDMFMNLGQRYLTAYRGLLKCGSLKCNVLIYPQPQSYQRKDDSENCERVQISNVLTVCGFMEISEVASPATLSRHLVLPCSNREKKEPSLDSKDDAGFDESKIPSLTVLLHGSLKVESMVAITRVSEDWYGMMFSWADNKKKSNLMLALFEPGAKSISWLGNINHLGPMSEMKRSTDDDSSPFPVCPPDKRSYAQSHIIWIKEQGLQGDLQKVLRHARKLPEKQQQFYKEVNRIRHAALAFGFIGLMDALGAMLDRECTMLPGNMHPDAAMQLSHCASELRRDNIKHDVNQAIQPLITKFQGK